MAELETEGDITPEDFLQLHEDIIENNEDNIRELLKEFREDGIHTKELCSQEIEIEPLPDDHELNGISLTAIHRAALLESSCILSLLLGSSPGINIDIPLKSNGYSPLHVASHAGKASAVSFLAANGACVNALDSEKRSPMHHAAISGEADIAKILVVKGCSADGADVNGRTPLHYASEAGHHKIVQFLLKRGVTVDAVDAQVRTPLHLSQIQGHSQVAELLMCNGAKVYSEDKDGNTALHILARHVMMPFEKQPTIEIDSEGDEYFEVTNGNVHPDTTNTTIDSSLKALLRHRANPNIRNKSGHTVLHVATIYNNQGFVYNILRHGASVTIVDQLERTPLFYAEGAEIVQLLLEYTSSAKAIDSEGNTPLHMFMENKNITISSCEAILNQGADVDSCNKIRETPLFCACRSGDQTKVDFLLARGAQTDLVNRKGQTIVHVSLLNKHFQLTCHLVLRVLNVNLKAVDNSKKTALLLAIEIGHIGVVESLVEGGSDVNIRGPDGLLPATRAAILKRSTVLPYLLSHGALYEEREHIFSLHDFALMGDLETVRYLIENKAELNRVDGSGKTCLHVALQHGKWDIVQCFLDLGISVTMCDQSGDTALHTACRTCLIPHIFQQLLTQGAVINEMNNQNETPLHICTTESTVEIVSLLLANGADCDLRDKNGRTALHSCLAHAYEHSEMDLTTPKNIVHHLAEKGNQTTFDGLDQKGVGVLHYLSHFGWCTAMKSVLTKGAAVNLLDVSSMTPLHYACAAGQRNAASLLVENGSNVQLGDSNRQTPLYHAVLSGNMDLVEFILGANADPSSPNEQCRSPLHTAIGERKFDIAEVLIMNEADVNGLDLDNQTPLHIASPLSPITVVESLVLQGSKVNTVDKHGKTPLHASVDNPDTKVMKFLLSKGALAEAEDEHGNTPLHLVAKLDCYNKADMLLTAGAEVDAKNKDGDTPLLLAAQNTGSDVVELLIANEADVTERNRDGLTPLMIAIKAGNTEAAQILLDHESENDAFDPNLADDQGNTAIIHAAKLSPFCLPLVKDLQRHGASLQTRNSAGKSAIAIIQKRSDVDIDRVQSTLQV